MNELKRNASGYIDPTAYKAITNIEKEEKKVATVIKTLKSVANLAGFHIEGRIVLVDKTTGKEWR